MAKEQLSYKDRIIQDPNIMVGKPVVKGTRIPVETVLQHLAEIPDFEDLFRAFPHLTTEDVRACLEYAVVAVQRKRKAKQQALDKEADDIWAGYDPEKVREALRKSAGALAGVDTAKLIQDIYEARGQNSLGRPGD